MIKNFKFLLSNRTCFGNRVPSSVFFSKARSSLSFQNQAVQSTQKYFATGLLLKSNGKSVFLSTSQSSETEITQDSNLYDVIYGGFGKINEYRPEVAEVLRSITQYKEHFDVSRLDRIVGAVFEQEKEMFQEVLRFLTKEEIEEKKTQTVYHYFYYSFDGFIYEGCIIRRYLASLKKNVIEIKLSNDGFIYRNLKKFDQISESDWNGGRNWYIMTVDQSKAFPNILSLIPLLMPKAETVTFKYHAELSRFDVVVEDLSGNQGVIQFEDKWPYMEENPQTVGFKYSLLQIPEKIEKGISDTESVFFGDEEK